MKIVIIFCLCFLTFSALPDGIHAASGPTKPGGCGESACGSCEPAFLCCQREFKTEKVKKTCYEVECEYVCIPPVCLPECCYPFGSRCSAIMNAESACGSCGAEGCQVCCETPVQREGLLQKLCSKLTACRIRKVNRLKKEESEVEECITEWSVVCMQPFGSCSKSCGYTSYSCADPCSPCGEPLLPDDGFSVPSETPAPADEALPASVPASEPALTPLSVPAWFSFQSSTLP